MALIKINIILKVILGILVKMIVEIALTHEWSKKTTVRGMEQELIRVLETYHYGS